MDKAEVSVIVLTYNSDFEKLKKTLLSVLNQKGLDFEVIVCDDGSKEKCFDEIKKLFDEHGFKNYKFVDNKENKGTIKNYLSGLYEAKGEYAFAISAGDMLYDEEALKSFLSFAKENDVEILFGDCICYNFKEGKIKIYNEEHSPRRPEIYDIGADIKKAKREMFLGDQVIGVAYFRKTEIAIKYFEKLTSLIRYAEDNPSTLFAYEEGVKINHFNRKVVWYEYATGMSNAGSSPMAQKIIDEFKVIYAHLAKEYKGNVEDCAMLRTSIESKKKMALTCFLKHPFIYTSHLIYQKIKKPSFYADEEAEKNKLYEYLKKLEAN